MVIVYIFFKTTLRIQTYIVEKICTSQMSGHISMQLYAEAIVTILWWPIYTKSVNRVAADLLYIFFPTRFTLNICIGEMQFKRAHSHTHTLSYTQPNPHRSSSSHYIGQRGKAKRTKKNCYKLKYSSFFAYSSNNQGVIEHIQKKRKQMRQIVCEHMRFQTNIVYEYVNLPNVSLVIKL